ncbi:MAG TPA: trypsin-like peptidase domain-containing protein [Methanocella sp.]|uniref:S1C family serine protease n=1 Tax=Methanocella sp. TaxID=2052833 RepID=UPI002B80E797|nr:trypsin-like peptidase domain-containing protein [Methanocella sp.]HTY90437.1 trypsin-like peptidase domain-containing protein [Methanocella sp.]
MIPIDEEELVRIIENASPWVVNISVSMVQDAYMNAAPVQGMGSGIIVDEAGYILTNNHIVENTDGMVVSMFDGTRLDGTLVGNDPMSDVAVVKVSGKKKLPVAKLGDSDTVKVGHTAIAIGNPFGFMLRGPTVTIGVISALNRTIQAEKGVYENLFQTDAHINPGNSGGPLLNSKGEVIGMNSANIPFAQGIGFSIPINSAMAIARELIEHGKVIRPWLGILGIGLNKEIASYYNLSAEEGVLITRSFENSPAWAEGITSGDVILKVDGKAVKDMTELAGYVRKKKIGDVITLSVRRGNLQGDVKVRLAEIPTSK